jgi:EmrB/QacA subfamily drug resistance transporter
MSRDEAKPYPRRWIAMVFVSLGLAIVVIDNTVLNVSIPYILRDLNAPLSSLEFVVSGYSLTIASVLITFGRIGDLIGRRRLFIYGIIVFIAGSLIGSFAGDANTIIFGRAVIQALGAAMTLTAALSLIDSLFTNRRERALAFGVWGAIVGASATAGPLLGGYLTTFYSWRWSLRINVFVGIVALAGTLIIPESKGLGEKHFDWVGTVLSGAGLFSLVYALIEGGSLGWVTPNKQFTILGREWPYDFSVTPVLLAAAAVLLVTFALWEIREERIGRRPLLAPSMFKTRTFSLGLIVVSLATLGVFGVTFMLPIYFENVLSLNALQSGIYFLPATGGILVFGLASGFLAEKFNIKWIIIVGMIIAAAGAVMIIPSITPDATVLSLAPGLILFGVGFGLCSSQLNNAILSAAPLTVAGEASSVAITVRQIGASIGIAVIGALLAGSLVPNLAANIEGDTALPIQVKEATAAALAGVDLSSGQLGTALAQIPPQYIPAIRADVGEAIIASVQSAQWSTVWFVVAGAVLSLLFIPWYRQRDEDETPAAS